MKRLAKAVMFICIAIGAQTCVAYDTETHALMTREATRRSSLMGGQTLSVLGLNRLSTTNPFRAYWIQDSTANNYYVLGGADYTPPQDGYGGVTTFPAAFERCQMQEFLQMQLGPNDPRAAFQELFSDTVEIGTDAPWFDPILPIQNWIVRGGIREDDMGTWKNLFTSGVVCGSDWRNANENPSITRSYNHFFDPWNNIGLQSLIVNGKRSVDWALGAVDSYATPPQVDSTRQNFYSYEDARNFFYWAMTRELTRKNGQPYTANNRMTDARDRAMLWASLFRSIGNVVHLVQDTAQPQHTRNDPHSPVTTSDEQQAFEDYANYRVLGSGILNDHIWYFFPDEAIPAIPAPPLGSYPNVAFATPERYFSTRNLSSDAETRYGLADYTNRGFFSGGTLPGMPGNANLPSPPPFLNSNGTLINNYQETKVACPLAQSNPDLEGALCTHFTHPVQDSVVGNYPDVLPAGFTSPPLASKSTLAEILELEPYSSVMAPEDFDTSINFAFPRAIGYSAGIIDYFFRGVGGLVLSPPSSGIYAVLDHGQPHSMTTDGYPCVGTSASDGCDIFGFKHLQLQVASNMAPVTDVALQASIAQKLTNGTLVAVARFHRDTCYTPDLNGEPSVDADQYANATDPSQVTISYHGPCASQSAYLSGRSPYAEIAVSAALPVTPDGSVQQDTGYVSINSNTPSLITFDFSADPIPVNATDLFIEVVFRGVVGDTSGTGAMTYETDGIAVGSIDVSEPTFSTFINMTAYFYAYGTSFAPYNGWSTAYQITNPDAAIAPVSLPTINICSDNYLLMNIADGSGTGLPPGKPLRVATILDSQAPTTHNLWANYVAEDEDGLTRSFLLGLPQTWKYESSSVGPDYGIYNQFAVHFNQASTEDASLSPIAYSPLVSGAGVTWGDNFAFSYWHAWGDLAPWVPLATLFPTDPLPGNDGGVTATPAPANNVYLNMPDSRCN